MRQICAWCGKRLHGSRGRAGGKTSYGICVPCAQGLITDTPDIVKEFADLMNRRSVAAESEEVVKTVKRRRCALPP